MLNDSRKLLWLVCAGALCVLAVLGSGLVAEAEEDSRSVVARVNGEAVYAEEVERELRDAFGELSAGGEIPAETRRRAAEQVVDRRLVLLYLAESRQGASEQDVDFAIEQLRNELKAQGVTLTEYLRRGGWREEDFRRHLAWTLGWQRFLGRTLTEANLQKYFERHLPDFDGREVRVAHLLLKVEPGNAAGRAKTLQEAARIRQEIEAGNLTFADAVRKRSQAPTAAVGGEVGWIRRHEPMPEAFSKAALWLEKDAVSEPVVTTFGVHLIQCLEVRPGKRGWRDAEGELRKAVAQYLFEWAAERQRGKVLVQWEQKTGAVATSDKK